MSTATVVLEDHLTLDTLESALSVVPRSCSALVVDCRAMSGYDSDARARFVEWNAERRDIIRRVAVVTENMLWHMIIAAMALASRQDMKAFNTVDDARAWADA